MSEPKGTQIYAYKLTINIRAQEHCRICSEQLMFNFHSALTEQHI